MGQLVRGVDLQDLLCQSDYQDGRGRLHWQKQSRICQCPLGTTTPASRQACTRPQGALLERETGHWCPSNTCCASGASQPFYLIPAVSLGGDVTVPILKKDKLRLREVKGPGQAHSQPAFIHTVPPTFVPFTCRWSARGLPSCVSFLWLRQHMTTNSVA